MLTSMFSPFFLALSLGLGVYANSHILQNRHHEIAKRHATDVQLHKRFSDSRWTFYDVGLGACGKTNVATDFIVALNVVQFGAGYPGPNCFKMITMNFNGISAQAQIMDECMGCPYGGLDLSRGLFEHFSSLGAGVISGTWSFNDGSGGGGSPPSPPPKTTTTWQQPWTQTSTSTWEQPSSTPPAKPKPSSTTSTTTSSEKPSPTTSHTTTTSTSSTSTSVDYTSNGLAVPTGTLLPNIHQNLNSINTLLIQYGCLIVAAGSAH